MISMLMLVFFVSLQVLGARMVERRKPRRHTGRKKKKKRKRKRKRRGGE